MPVLALSPLPGLCEHGARDHLQCTPRLHARAVTRNVRTAVRGERVRVRYSVPLGAAERQSLRDVYPAAYRIRALGRWQRVA